MPTPADPAEDRSRPRFDLRAGPPDESRFPRGPWLRALRAAFGRATTAALRGDDPRGLPELRDALAGYLARARGVRADPAQIVICSGFRQGLGLLCRALAQSGIRHVGLEEYTLPQHRSVVTASGLDMAAVRIDNEGAVVDGLGSGAVVLTPAHQFPLGVTLTAARRTAWLDWARQTGSVLIEDDYDGEFRYDRQPVGALQGLDPNVVVYAGTASKMLARGLRLGWLVPPAWLVEPLVEQKDLADGGSGITEQLALAEMIRNYDLDRHVRASRLRYGRRRNQLVAALDEHLPALRPRGIAAGLHVLLELPPTSPPPEAIEERAACHDIAFRAASYYHHTRRSDLRAVVIGYGTPPEHSYGQALRTLVSLLATA